MPPLTRDLAGWVASLRAEQAPARVRYRTRMQVLSVLASAHAGLHCPAVRSVLSAVGRWGTGELPVVASGARHRLHAALLANAATGMALDYDDYLFLGHTGHSSVWVPLLLGAEVGADPADVEAAILAANEVGGRLGAACLFGPQNGQLWSFIHLAGAACAAARVLRLDPRRTADALGIALAQPNYALFPAFMGPGAKLLTAATPAVAGLQAAQFAADGLTGCATILEEPRGFLSRFSFHPLPHMLSGWGEAWVSDALVVKPFPGCAYVGTTVDLLHQAVRELGGPFSPREIAAVDVRASILSCEMDRLGRAHSDRNRLSPIDVNFSIPLSAALALQEGGLSAAAFSDERLLGRREQILELAGKVHLKHDWGLTMDLADHFRVRVGLDRFFGGMGLADLLRVRRCQEEAMGRGELTFGIAELLRIRREVPGAKRAPFATALARMAVRRAPAPRSLAGADLDGLTVPAGARVTVRTADGREWRGESRVPCGAAARPDFEAVAREKWRREAAALGTERVLHVERLVDALDRTSAREILEAASPDGH